MTAYNISLLEEAETVLDIVNYANVSSNQVLFGLFMVGIFFVMILALKKWDFEDTLLSASFVCFVLSLLATFADLLNIIFPLMFLALAAFTAFYSYITKRN